MIRLNIPGKPVGRRSGRLCGWASPEERLYTSRVQDRVMFAMLENEVRIADVDEFTGKVLISLTAYFADGRHPDMDNIAKLVADALEGLCYWNDRQVAWGKIDYTIGDPYPRLELEISWGDQPT